MLHHHKISPSYLLLILCGLAALGIFSTSLYLPSLPAIKAGFQTTQEEVQLTLTFFFLGSCIGQLFLGPLSDIYGRRIVIVSGLSGFILLSLICPFVPSIYFLQISRFFQGMAASSGPLISRAISRDIFEGPQLTHASSTIMMVISFSPIVAPLIGGFFEEYFGWKANFFFLACSGLFLLGLIHFKLPETNIFKDYNPKHLKIRNSGKNYFLLLTDKHFIGLCLSISGQLAGIFAFITFSPFAFMEVFGWSTAQYSIVIALIGLGQIIGFAYSRHLSHKVERNLLLKISSIISQLNSLLFFLLCYLDVVGPAYLITYISIFFILSALLTSNATSAAMDLSPRTAGIASAFLGSLQIGFGALGSAVVAILGNNLVLFSLAMLCCSVFVFLALYFAGIFFKQKNNKK